MTWSSIETGDLTLVKGYGVLSFDKNIRKNIGKNINGNCSHKILDHAEQSATDVIKTTSKE